MKSKLSDICFYCKEKIAIAELSRENYISTENMLPNKNGVTIAASLPTTIQTQKYEKGDVLVSNIRPYFKKIWLANKKGGCSNDVLVFRAKNDIEPRYLYYVLANNSFFEYSMATAKGTKMPRGDKKALMEYGIPDFDLKEQHKIASILSTIDDKIQLNNKINKNLFEQAQALYKDRYIDLSSTAGKIPDGWHIGTVSEIIELHDSKRIPLSSREREKLNKIYPYYGATSVMDYVDRYLFDGIYLLLGEDGTVVDDKGFPVLQYVEGKFWVNNHAHIITGKCGFTVELLYLLFSLTNVKSIVTGAVQPKISQSNLNKVPVLIPDSDELESFDSVIQPFFAQIRDLRVENDRLATLRDTLLPKLMSGEIDVSDVDL
ncbi:restriction endonuclease subunit S [Megasphaera elsdenii]|jgi:type I restriction enzyme S subunit|uniref:restriction endonuclease subunit S n=1 Tax=Megasphaera elsdenii TaxID=907 RepID=UPI001D02403A|nr:restriction endonuclease subunit S [Megasphaera elsdenii]MCB5770913.1 restriction endonuclease subunit S [Megasphaera elsdenii]